MADLIRTFRLLNAEQRTAAVGALFLAVSTIGPFSFVEAAEILTAVGVLALLRARARGARFHLPFGDGTVIAAAGFWAAGLIAVRLFDRPLGQNLLALACAAVLVLAGARERAKRPPDDLPEEHRTPPLEYEDPGWTDAPGWRPQRERPRRRPEATGADKAETEPLAPPEFEPHRPGRQPPGEA
jgi:hypothetical protein